MAQMKRDPTDYPGSSEAGSKSAVIVVRNRFHQPDLGPGSSRFIKSSVLNSPTSPGSGTAVDPSGLDITKQSEQYVEKIARNFDIDLGLKTVRQGFVGRNVNIITSQTLLIERAKYPRGYIIVNPPAIITSVTQGNVTFFPSAARTPAGNPHISTVVAVFDAETVRTWLDITAVVAGTTLTIDLQTQDPLTGNWATAQSNIFSGANTVGTFYANLGMSGIDRNARMIATVTGTSITFSVSGLLKGVDTSASSAVFIGPRDVTTTSGFPILAGTNERLFLLDNVELYAISLAATSLRVFQLQ